eukprot:6458968-Amphidinium_carterae.3
MSQRHKICGGKLGKEWRPERGILQGPPCSPLHSNLVFALVLKATADPEVKQYAYLDDLTYSSTSLAALQRVALRLSHTLDALQMKANAAKSFLVRDSDVVEGIALQGGIVSKTQQADLLGMDLNMEGSGDGQNRSEARW